MLGKRGAISLSSPLSTNSHCFTPTVSFSLSGSHFLTVSLSRYHHLTVSLSPSHCLTVTISLSHCLTVTISLSHCHHLTVSLSHCHHLTVSLSRYHHLTVTISLSHYHTITISLSHCHTITISLSHYHTVSLSRYHHLTVSPSRCLTDRYVTAMASDSGGSPIICSVKDGMQSSVDAAAPRAATVPVVSLSNSEAGSNACTAHCEILTLSHSRFLTLTASRSLSRSHIPTMSTVSHCLTAFLAHWLSLAASLPLPHCLAASASREWIAAPHFCDPGADCSASPTLTRLAASSGRAHST